MQNAPRLFINLFHGRQYGEQLDEWGTQGPVFETDCGYFHMTYASDIKFGDSMRCVLEIVPSEMGGSPDCVFYDGVFYGDWSFFIEPDGRLRDELAGCLRPFDAIKAVPPAANAPMRVSGSSAEGLASPYSSHV